MVGPIRTTSLPSQKAQQQRTETGTGSGGGPSASSPSASTASSNTGPASTPKAATSTPLTPRRASCEFCRRRKIRCNGEDPCAACVQRKIACLFEREAPKGRPPRSSKTSDSNGRRESGEGVNALPPGSIPIKPSVRTMVPSRALSSFKISHDFDIQPEDIATPFWVQMGGKQGTVASALQDMWDRYFGPRDTNQPSSSFVQPDAASRPGTPSSQVPLNGKGKGKERKDSRFPQTTFDSGEDEFHWVAGFSSSIQMMIQGMVELSCNVYSQLGCTWIGKPFFFVYMMQVDPTQRMFESTNDPGPNPLDSLPLDQMLSMIEIFFAHNAQAALFSKTMLIEQCKEYKLGRMAFSNSENIERLAIPAASPLLLATVIAEAIPDSIEDDEDELVVDTANRLRVRLKKYAEHLLFSTSVEPAAVSSHTPSNHRSSDSSTRVIGQDHNDEEDILYDLSTIQALVLIGARELTEGTSPRKAACFVGVVARMLSHMRAKESASPGRKKKEEEERLFPGNTYRAVNEEIRINVEWFITAIAAWFFCQLERPLGSILPPANILRFPPLRICRSASLQMDKRKAHVTSLRRQAQLVEQLWTCATVTVTVCLIHDLHPSSQERQRKSGISEGAQTQQKLWQEEKLKDLKDLGKPKFNMLELCERIQRYLDDYLKDMEKNKAPPTAIAFLEASFMAIYVHTLLPTMTEADINWNTGIYFRKHTFDLYIAATKRILVALEPWASTSRTKSSMEMFSRRYEVCQKQLSDIFVLALDACQRALRVIVDYAVSDDVKGFVAGEAEPPRTKTGWLMPTDEVLDYIREGDNVKLLLNLAEQAQLASGSTFLRVGLHARRVEEGFTSCISTIRDKLKFKLVDAGEGGARSTDIAATDSAMLDAASDRNPASAGDVASEGVPTMAGASSTQQQQTESSDGLFSFAPPAAPRLDNDSSSSHTTLDNTGVAMMPAAGPGQGASTVIHRPRYPDMSSFIPASQNSNNNDTGPGDDPLSTMWWNQQASALPMSLPTVTGMDYQTNTMNRNGFFGQQSGPQQGHQSQAPYGHASSSYGGGGHSMGNASMSSPTAAYNHTTGTGSGVMSVMALSGRTDLMPPAPAPPHVGSSVHAAHYNHAGGVANTGQDLLMLDDNAWANATIPDSWLAAAFYANMEVLRTGGI
ncbi:hypothetical protein V8E36_006950 [Tilletia maclaganii]